MGGWVGGGHYWGRVGAALSVMICWGFFSGRSVEATEGTASSSLSLPALPGVGCVQGAGICRELLRCVCVPPTGNKSYQPSPAQSRQEPAWSSG